MSGNFSIGRRCSPLLCVSIVAALSAPFAASVAVANPQLMSEVDTQAASEVSYANFQQWLRDFRQYAAGQGVSEATLSNALDGVRYRERVIELDGYQPNLFALFGSIWIPRFHPRVLLTVKKSWLITVTLLSKWSSAMGCQQK